MYKAFLARAPNFLAFPLTRSDTVHHQPEFLPVFPARRWHATNYVACVHHHGTSSFLYFPLSSLAKMNLAHLRHKCL
jgi:hypothetical protein